MRLYQGGCSFVSGADIFVDSNLYEYFAKNGEFHNFNNSTGGISNTQIFRKAIFSILKSDFDFVFIGWSQCWRDDKSVLYKEIVNEIDAVKLLNESYQSILSTHIGYESIVPNNKFGHYCKFEPEATDDTILYTIILHTLLKSKNIPHLFITMGENNLKTLESRRGWLDLIDPKNYYGEGDIVSKMAFSVTKYFQKKHVDEGYPNIETHSLNGLGYISDIGLHLNNNARTILSDDVLNYIIKNELLKL